MERPHANLTLFWFHEARLSGLLQIDTWSIPDFSIGLELSFCGVVFVSEDCSNAVDDILVGHGQNVISLKWSRLEYIGDDRESWTFVKDHALELRKKKRRDFLT